MNLTKGQLVMTDKWAVEIQSEAEARELQGLFPEEKTIIGRTIPKMYREGMEEFGYPEFCASRNKYHEEDDYYWSYADTPHYKPLGYTILSLTELKELLTKQSIDKGIDFAELSMGGDKTEL